MSYSEAQFILPIKECTDTKEFTVNNGYITRTYQLNQLDYAYWLMEDYKIPYNKEKFMIDNFEERLPVRDVFFRFKDDEASLASIGY